MTLRYHLLTLPDITLLYALSQRGLAAVYLGDDGERLISLLQRRHPQQRMAHFTAQHIEAELCTALTDCWMGKPISLTMPLDLQGTDFQLSVWQALRRIPHGQTRSYKAIAADIGRPTAYRAVANACGANPVSLLVPCHRVTASDGPGGYHWGGQHKLRLLRLERSHLAS